MVKYHGLAVSRVVIIWLSLTRERYFLTVFPSIEQGPGPLGEVRSLCSKESHQCMVIQLTGEQVSMCPCVLALYSSTAPHHTFSETVRSSQCVLQSLSFTRMTHTEHWWTLCSQGYLCVSVWSTRATNQSVCDTSTVKTFTQLLITAVTISYQQLLVKIMLFYIGRN